MKTVKFSEQELEFMRQLYLDELADAENYILQIKEILKKLGVPEQSALEETPAVEPKKPEKRRGRKTQVKPVEPKEPKKRGRKPKTAVSNIIESLVAAKQPDEKVATVAEPKEYKRKRKGPKAVHSDKTVESTKRSRNSKKLESTPENAENPLPEKKTTRSRKKAEPKPKQRKTRRAKVKAEPVVVPPDEGPKE